MFLLFQLMSLCVRQLNTLKLRHKDECKGLIVQIRYLKAKFTRENDMRVHLTHQKEYLLILLSRYEKRFAVLYLMNEMVRLSFVLSEKKILATIAQAGPPCPSSPKRPKSLRAVAITVLFVLRARYVIHLHYQGLCSNVCDSRSSEHWREQRSSRAAVLAAYNNVRQTKDGKK